MDKGRLALLGQDSDAKLAAHLGLSRVTVTLKCPALGIPIYDRINWGQTELDLLGRYPDEEVATLTVRRVENVSKKRKELGIRAYRNGEK